MSPINYILIPIAIMQLADLSLLERNLLGLIASFKEKGLKLSNSALGDLFGVTADHISDCLANLHRKKHIEIRNGRSRYRVIYFRKNPEVKTILLPESTGLLPEISGFTSGKIPNRIKGSKGNKRVRFQKPTVEEVKAYADSIGFFNLDAPYFIDSYESKGWLIGKTPMKDWQAAVRTWHKRDEQSNPSPTHDATDEEAAALLRG